MPPFPRDSEDWSDHELKMIGAVDVFQAKPRILKKAEERLLALNRAMDAELKNPALSLPAHLDRDRSQVARGENHRGFPYISLDRPQMFSKTDMFTFRSLFWWGHYLGFALILKGSEFGSWTRKLVEDKDREEWKNVFLATAPNPWEWEQTDENFMTLHLQPKENIIRRLEPLDYLNLCRFSPVPDAEFPRLNWTAAGVNTWRVLSGIVSTA